MFVANVWIHSMKPKHGTVVWCDYFGQTGITSSKLDLFWPTNASSASGHRASRWTARATPIKKWALVSEAVRGPEPTCSCPGAAAVLMTRATLEAADVRGRAEPLSRCGHHWSCGAIGHPPPPRARPGADARAPPRTPASAGTRRTALSLRRGAMPCFPGWGCFAPATGISRSGSAAAGRRSRPR